MTETGLRIHDPRWADQHTASTAADIEPVGEVGRQAYAASVTMQAVVYGVPAVYQYAAMCDACAPTAERPEWTINSFVHERTTADAGFDKFRVPNVDTLYSNGWLDLTAGPVTLDLPDFGDRYVTLEFLDTHSNASNVSARTHSVVPRRLIVVTAEHDVDAGAADEKTVLFRVATPLMWVLMRIQVFGDGDIDVVRGLQNSVVVTGPPNPTRNWPVHSREDVESSPSAFLEALEAVIDLGGVPDTDAALVRQFRAVNVGPETPKVSELSAPALRGVRSGFDSAMDVLASSRSRLGRLTDSGWTRVLDKGAHGSNFLARAVMNFVGLGANVVDENCSYNTYADSSGRPLNGGDGVHYVIEFADPPPAEAFWSITLYHADTGWLYDAPGRRFSVGSGTRDGIGSTGPDVVLIGHVQPDDDSPGQGAFGRQWLPAPDGPFFLVLRMYRPTEAALTERWAPPSVERYPANSAARL